MAGEDGLDVFGRGVVLDAGLVDSLAELRFGQEPREVDERAGGGGNGNVAPGHPLRSIQRLPRRTNAIDASLIRSADFRYGLGSASQAKEVRRRTTAEDRTVATGENSSNKKSVHARCDVPDAVDARMHSDEPPFI